MSVRSVLLTETESDLCDQDSECLSIPAGVTDVGKYASEWLKIGKRKDTLVALFLCPNSKIESIPCSCFNTCRRLAYVVLPSWVQRLEDRCFCDCQSLKVVMFESPSQLNYMGKWAMSSTSLETICIPKRVTVISDSCFENAKTLREVRFERGSELKRICDRAFCGCLYLMAIEIPVDVECIEHMAFCGCIGLNKLKFPANSKLSVIADVSFEQCALSSLTIPASVTIIDKYAFRNCRHLTRLVFEPGSQLESLCLGCFRGCNIESVVIPSAVKVIKGYVFYDCNRLSDVKIADGSKLESIDEHAFSCTAVERPIEIPKDTKVKDSFRANSCSEKVEYVRPTNTLVGSSQATCMKSHENVVHPEIDMKEVERVYVHGLLFSSYVLSPEVFQVCMLVIFYVPDDVRKIPARSFYTLNRFKECVMSELSRVKVIGTRAFACCPNLESIRIPQLVTFVENEAFLMCRGLRSVVFAPGSVLQRIREFAFACSWIEEIIFPDTATIIGEGSFAFCGSLRRVVFGKNCQNIENRAFIRCMKLTDISFERCTQLDLYLGAYAFSDTEIRELVIPASLHEIDVGCFSGCFHLQKVTFERVADDRPKLIYLGSGCFGYCQIGIIDFGNRQLEFQHNVRYTNDFFTHRSVFMCSRITKIYLDSAYWSSSIGRIFDGTSLVDRIYVSPCSSPSVGDDRLYRFFTAIGFRYIARDKSYRHVGEHGREAREVDMTGLSIKYLGPFTFCRLTSIKLDKSIEDIGEWCFNKWLHNIEYDNIRFYPVGRGDMKWVPVSKCPTGEEETRKLNAMMSKKESSSEFSMEVANFHQFWRNKKDTPVHRRDVPYMTRWDSNFSNRIYAAGSKKDMENIIRKGNIQQEINNGNL